MVYPYAPKGLMRIVWYEIAQVIGVKSRAFVAGDATHYAACLATQTVIMPLANDRAFSYHSSAAREQEEEHAPSLLPSRWLLAAS